MLHIGPLRDDDTLYQDLDFKTKEDLTKALCGKNDKKISVCKVIVK